MKILDPFKPLYREGDLVVVRPEVHPLGGTVVIAANDVIVFRVVDVFADRRAKDRVVDEDNEAGGAHQYNCEVVGCELTEQERRRSKRTFLQKDLAFWSARKDEVLAAFRKRLAELEAL